MRWLSIAIIVLSALFSGAAIAQKGELPGWNYKHYVDDANSIANYLMGEKMSVADVAAVASIGCDAFQAARKDNFFENSSRLIQVASSENDAIKKIEFSKFKDFERENFRKAGAQKPAMYLLERLFMERPSFPASFADLKPLQYSGRIEALVCRVSQTAAAEISKDPAINESPVSSDQKVIAEAIGWMVIGASVMAVNGYVSVQSGGYVFAVMGIASGGWGWNRIEDAYKTLEKSFNSPTN